MTVPVSGHAVDEWSVHPRVVDNHVVVLDASALVVLSYATEGVEEETVTELHDVRLVDTSDFLQRESAPHPESGKSFLLCGYF